MSVAWKYRGAILFVIAQGDYSTAEFEKALSEALDDPRFEARMPILFDGRRSEAMVTPEGIERRVEVLVSLWERGLLDRCAVVVREEAHRYGLGRMQAIRLELRGMTGFRVFYAHEMDEALRWLQTRRPSDSKPE